ncbi:MAG: aminopeptidase [Clostridioides sp.]|jgi:aminopeptidase|nr:aminopeptidase [Clostridioides sp.]
MDFSTKLQKFAELAIQVGVNIKPGEDLMINADIVSAPFVRLAVEEAYKCGAKNVYVDWADEATALIKYLHAPMESFDEFPKWTADARTSIAKNGGAFLSIISSNPDLLKEVDPIKVSNFQKASGKALKEWRSFTGADKCKWSIVAVPSPEWAKKVFPELSEEDAISKLWDKIFDCSRVSDGDPVAAWKEHNATLKEKMNFLNKMNFKKLTYTSSKTNLTVELPEGHVWLSGASQDPKGNDFNPNIPTEEVFGMPHKYKVNGTVFSTKPLVYGGNIINNFSITFKDGKIIDWTAEEGYETLSNLIGTDDGSHYLGEVALVPYDSPISNSNIVFYTTLFDENASCHLAIGSAYATNIVGGENMSDEDKEKHGVNDSMTHVDFMVGSEDLDIVGVTGDGETVQIFKAGNWA